MGRKPVIVGANEEVQGCFGEDRITNMVILILKDHAIKSPEPPMRQTLDAKCACS